MFDQFNQAATDNLKVHSSYPYSFYIISHLLPPHDPTMHCMRERWKHIEYGLLKSVNEVNGMNRLNEKDGNDLTLWGPCTKKERNENI